MSNLNSITFSEDFKISQRKNHRKVLDQSENCIAGNFKFVKRASSENGSVCLDINAVRTRVELFDQ